MSGLRELSRCARQLPVSSLSRTACPKALRRCASTQAAPQDASATTALADLEPQSSFTTSNFGEGVEFMGPEERVKAQTSPLPAPKYRYIAPRYYRGPLHPIQPPPSWDPTARDFVPGPFNIPRLKQTYKSTIASDLMTLMYQHQPPGTIVEYGDFMSERLGEWDGSSPYHKNRPRKGPRGATLRLPERPITFRNIPKIESVSIDMFQPQAVRNESYLWVARAMLQSISGAIPEVTFAKNSVAVWGLLKGRKCGVKVTIEGDAAYEFLDKCVHLVFPGIKEWPGVKGSSGDNKGSIAFGLAPSDVALFPEVQANYNMYPSKMMPGARVYVKTTAKSNRQARLLMQSLGVPFFGSLK